MTIKSPPVRAQFSRVMIRNIKRAFAAHKIDISINPGWSRIFMVVEAGSDQNLVESLLSRIFGISSFSRVEGVCEARLESILDLGKNLYAQAVADKSFAVAAQRSGNHSFSSIDVKRELGAVLNPFAQKVDLKDPDVLIELEVRNEKACFFSKRTKASGGLPLGTGGRALALVSGGFDSMAAAWMCMRRGTVVEFLLFELVPGGVQKREVEEILQKFAWDWAPGYKALLHVVDFTKIVTAIRDRVRESYAQVILKRLFYRSAQIISAERNTEAIITGEALGQVSSQTITNLAAMQHKLDICLLRPLIAFEKQDIIDKCKQIGIYDLCARTQEFCQIVPSKPVTHAPQKILLAEENNLNISDLRELLGTYRIHVISGSPQDQKSQYMETSHSSPVKSCGNSNSGNSEFRIVNSILPHCILITIGDSEISISKEHTLKNITPGTTLTLSLDEIWEHLNTFDRKLGYIFSCEKGFQSKIAATIFRDNGFKEVFIWQA